MPLPLFLAFALQNPNLTADAINKYNTPGQVDATQLQSSVADFAMQAINCYHHSARFRGVDILGGPWREQEKFGAEGSVVLRVHLGGVSGSGYQMIIAAMAKGENYRAFVINENTLVPYNKNCSLERWTSAQSSE
ncbi:hypothetical protein [Ralstonia sp. RL]|uniref:hypothetical protein n=1 Tax=Ralstonia sp. RL TaxID=1839756 RepID=UPI000B190ED7|nr:hypothetical protein [Ralstonia sp. RL]